MSSYSCWANHSFVICQQKTCATWLHHGNCVKNASFRTNPMPVCTRKAPKGIDYCMAENPAGVAGLHAAKGLRALFWRSNWTSAGKKRAFGLCWMDNRLLFPLFLLSPWGKDACISCVVDTILSEDLLHCINAWSSYASTRTSTAKHHDECDIIASLTGMRNEYHDKHTLLCLCPHTCYSHAASQCEVDMTTIQLLSDPKTPRKASVCWTLTVRDVQIKQATGAKGPEIGKITDELIKWQLAHPDATQQDAEAWLSKLS